MCLELFGDALDGVLLDGLRVGELLERAEEDVVAGLEDKARNDHGWEGSSRNRAIIGRSRKLNGSNNEND